MKLTGHLFLLLLWVTACCAPIFAQSTNASITGFVEDSSKALIPAAAVTAINTQTGARATTTTNIHGLYVLPDLQPGTWRIEVGKQGFKGIIEAGLVLHVQDIVEINFHLAVGLQTETVTVTADAGTNMNTTDGAVSTVIDQSYVQNMPLNGRSFQDLILLTPGALTTSPQQGSGLGSTGEFSVNGQRTESNYYTVDGVSANVQTSGGGFSAGMTGSLPASTALGTTQALASVDDLQEFRVQSSSYSAEYGRNPGGQFAFKTKSGSNHWNGSLYEYLRNGDADATDWFNDFYGISEPAIHQNDFGGALGGPATIPHLYDGKDRTFFFLSYEALRLINPQPASISPVPDAALRASVPAALVPPMNSFPVANGPDLGFGIAEYIGTWSNPNSINSTSIRFDHSVNKGAALFFRFSDTGSYAKSRGGNGASPSNPETIAYTLRTYTFGANSAMPDHLANEFRLNYSTNYTSATGSSDTLGGAMPLNLIQVGGLGSDGNAQFGFFADNDTYFPNLLQGITTQSQTQWNFIDTLSYSKGHHTLRLGIDYRRLTPIQGAYQSGSWTFTTETNLLANDADDSGTYASLSAYPSYTNGSLFVQDGWHLTPRFSVSMGLRWDVNPPPGVARGVQPYTLEGSDLNTVTLAPQGTPLWDTTWFNIAPRIGAAYTIRGARGWETVVRGGGGEFFDTGQQLGAIETYFGIGTSALSGTVSEPFPALPPIPPIVNPPAPPYYYASTDYAPHLQLPYTLQWNASIEQAIGKMQAFTLSYVGSHAARLLQVNLVEPSNSPDFPNGFYYVQNQLTSDYNSLQTQFQRRLSAGLTALASYTWSHCQDYGSENFNFGYQRGNCDFDVRHNFAGAFSYNTPSIRHRDVLGAVLNDWGIDNRITARTAFPITLTGNFLLAPNNQYYDSGVNLIPGQPIFLYGANCTSVNLALSGLSPGQTCPGGRGINPNAFVSVSTGLGDAPRNFVRGFNAIEFDSAIRREFPIHENVKLQFRAEAFNVFNHPNLGVIGGTWGVAGFGLAAATLANSLGALSPLYQMGGARSMQFSLRLAF